MVQAGGGDRLKLIASGLVAVVFTPREFSMVGEDVDAVDAVIHALSRPLEPRPIRLGHVRRDTLAG